LEEPGTMMMTHSLVDAIFPGQWDGPRICG
jgi:hypothetical protein